ncbi:MAG: hypothetical protein ACI9VR_003165 [Cognaticolwellia sp.]|jgi:hypothetical protein
MAANLKRKLQRAQVLARQGSSAGERQAARAAVQRLQARLRMSDSGELRDPGDAILPADPWLDPPTAPPTAGEIAILLLEWERGDLSTLQLQGWAHNIVGSVLLPDLSPSQAGAVEVEVVLQLSAMDNLPLDHKDLPALRAFLTCGGHETGWQAWFEYLSGTARPKQAKKVFADWAESS